MNGYAPIEFLRACRPIVIMDEPQNMETPIRQEAIRSLSPLFQLRYSATHRDLKHLVYRLTPVDAYDLRLVKRIGVLSITKDDDLNEAYVEVIKINATPGGVTATAMIHKATKQGTKPTQVTLRKDDDLFELSGGRDVYQGWAVEDIHAGRTARSGTSSSATAARSREGASSGSADDQQQRLMIRQAIESHFEKELQLKLQERRRTIAGADQAAHAVLHRPGRQLPPEDGKFRTWFEEEYEAVRADAEFRVARRCPTSTSSTTATSRRPPRACRRTRSSGATRRTPRAPSSGSCRTRRSCSASTSRCASSSATRRSPRAGTTRTSSRSATSRTASPRCASASRSAAGCACP